MNVAVIGLGHVGLVTAAWMAEWHQVVGYDENPERLKMIREGTSPFLEPGLDDLLEGGLASGKLDIAEAAAEAIRDADVVFLCVGTPEGRNGHANLAALERCAHDIALAARDGVVVVEKSTVPAGTAQRLERVIAGENPELVFHVASSPEFLREGSALADMRDPDRVVIGVRHDPEYGRDELAAQVLRDVYKHTVDSGRIVVTDIKTAELSKHASNTFLAMKISYANEIARLCEKLDADVDEVTRIMGMDERIGPQFLGAGLGYGGYCFPKDVSALIALAQRHGYDFKLARATERVNGETIEEQFEKVAEAVWNLQGKRIAVLGTSFKPGTDDKRSSPALSLIEMLSANGARLMVHDPSDTDPVTAFDACTGADCVVLATAWPEYRRLNWFELRKVVRNPVIVDVCNVLHGDEGPGRAGFAVIKTGRKYSAA